MSSYDFDNIERDREANEGLAYDEYYDRATARDEDETISCIDCDEQFTDPRLAAIHQIDALHRVMPFRDDLHA